MEKPPWNLWVDDQRSPRAFLYFREVEFQGMKFREIANRDFEVYLDLGYTAKSFHWAKNAQDAIDFVKAHGYPPDFVALDHDLGGHPVLGNHDIFHFLKWLQNKYPNNPPKFRSHSANWDGKRNTESFMESWHKSLTL